MNPFRPSLLAAGCAITVLAGCASLTPKTPEQVVAERAEARWTALIKRDFAAGHAYYQPAFRATFKPQEVIDADGGPPRAHAVRVHDVSCVPERCTVRMVFKVKAPISRSKSWDIETVRDETWVREDGQWWYERRHL